MQQQAPGAETGLIMGLLCVGRGIGSVVSGPLSEALLRNAGDGKDLKTGYDSGCENLIIFTGINVTLGGFGFGARKMGWL